MSDSTDSQSTINITCILSKRSETEKLITAEHDNLKSKIAITKKLAQEENRRVSNLEMKVNGLVNNSVSIVREIEQINTKIEELKEKVLSTDASLDKAQTKILRALTILEKEENTLNNSYQEMNKKSQALDSYCDSLENNTTVEEMEETKTHLYHIRNNLRQELERLKSNSEERKQKLLIHITITRKRITALKRKLDRKQQ